MNIIEKTLTEKLEKLQLKRNKVYNRMMSNPYSRICEIRSDFSKVIATYGICSKEALNYANKYEIEERHLLNEAKYLLDKDGEMLSEIISIDRQIGLLSQEISLITIRKNGKKI